ncbi:chitinase domain-containing protein 1 [Orussus abietinus]|uniref:chitinase domain-containing protein 1 n=1 Tax=Orussus abietinus TaxID=222816 RepID=UPI000626A5D8|nr:chitinase domain-containing protein 1 [Orussus abietinus]
MICNMRVLIFMTVLFLIIAFSFGTISPPSGKADKKQSQEKKNKKGPTDRNVFDRGLVVKDIKISQILRESGLYYENTTNRQFTGNVLGYVTPWNGEGYEVTKTFHGKFTTVSPVWLTFPKGDVITFQLTTYDVNKKWLQEMRKTNTEKHAVKVYPRIIYENWSGNDIANLHANSERMNQLVSTLRKTAKEFQFDGYVFELWNALSYSRANMNFVKDVITTIARKLKSNDLGLILAVPPSRGKDFQLFTKRDFDALASDVEAFSLMTYDYSSVQRPGPNSPLDWVRQCVEELVPNQDDPNRSKILLGINFYGNNYTPEGGGPIIGSQYLKLLKSLKGKVQWDEKSKEHFFELRSTGDSSYVFYPTLYSMKLRIDLAADLGTGISIWELGQGLNYFYDLL